MTIYRIVSKTSWNRSSANQEDDQFIDASDETEARTKYNPMGSKDTIESVVETPFKEVNDLKFYLVGLSPNWFTRDQRASHYFLVQATDGRNATKIIEKNKVGKHGTSTKVNDIRYLGKPDLNQDITQLL